MISIVIPIYNQERFLSRCIDSVLRSSYQDFELILVNDGSTDASLRICEGYAARDGRVRLLGREARERRGVSYARNQGLEVCRGEWVVFIDGDDVIAGDFLELAVRESAQDPDLILFDFAPREEDLGFGNLEEAVRYSGEEMLDLVRRTLLYRQPLEQGNANLFSSCARAVKRSVIERYGIRFSEDLFSGEDTLFNIEFLLRAESCRYVPRMVYFYNIYWGSSTHRFNAGLPDNHELLIEKIRRVLEEQGVFSALEREYNSFALNLLTSLLFRTVFSPENPKTFREKRGACERFRENQTFRQAMTRNLWCGSIQRRGFLVFFQMKCYRTLSAVCRLLHVIWGRKGIY